MGHLGWPEVIIIFVVLLLVFGVGRITTIGGELGAGIKAFKEGLSGKRNDEAESEKSDNSGEVKK